MIMAPETFKVFVVDDERVIAFTLAAILTQSGFAATAFTNPKDVLDRAQSESPDLLLSDVMMPEMSGIDLAMELKIRCPECKILLFSGQAATASLLEDARSKGHDFALLSKPIHPTDLLTTIRKISPQM